MNPRTFCVNDLAQVEANKDARYYQTSLWKLDRWKKLLTGRVDLVRVAKRVIPKIKSVLRARTGGSGTHDDVPGYLRVMAERGVDTFLLVAENDPGVDYVDTCAGERMRELASVSNYRREDLHGTDHTFTSVWSQQHVRTTVREHLARRHLLTGPGPVIDDPTGSGQ
jgi:hypothetical protein